MKSRNDVAMISQFEKYALLHHILVFFLHNCIATVRVLLPLARNCCNIKSDILFMYSMMSLHDVIGMHDAVSL